MKRLLAFPVLLSLFPALFLYAHNADLVDVRELALPAALLGGLVAALWGLAWFLLRDALLSALLSTLWTFGSFWFGVCQAFSKLPLLLWALVMACLTLLILRFRPRSPSWVPALNVAACALLLLPLWTLLSHETRLARLREASKSPGGASTLLAAEPTPGRRRCNFVHIVLDGYGRSDILRSRYGLDDSAFLRGLEERGFVVVAGATSNYWQTQLSLASTLNLSYLESSPASPFFFSTGLGDRGTADKLIDGSLAARTLRRLGYVTEAFATGYPGTEVRSADLFRDPGVLFGTLTPYQAGLLEMTPVPAVARLGHVESLDPYEAHRKQILFTLDHLAEASDRRAPLFVFAHVVCPHPPFVFTAEGAPVPTERPFSLSDGTDFVEAGGSTEEYRRLYADQVRFLNGRVLQAIDRLLERASRPTVILLHADHGPGSGTDWQHPERTDFPERFGILMALRAPQLPSEVIPRDFTLVNVYRLLFRFYFGIRLAPLENRHYYMGGGDPPGLVRIEPPPAPPDAPPPP